ncbi:unnamed protein product [Ixodes hexagonus]
MAGGDGITMDTSFRCMIGFSDALDRRPMLFQEPVVAQRACAVCGVLSRKAVRLPCAHMLCGDCHAECVQQGATCPLDREPFSDDVIDCLEASNKFLGQRKVACWNLASGCKFVGPASSILEHFKHCAFHAVSCPQCHSSVLRNDIVRHCMNGCRIPSVAPVHAYANRSHDSIEQARVELREALGKISDDLLALQTSLNQCCEDIRATDAGCKLQLQAHTSRLRDISAICAAGFSEQQRALQSVAADVKSTVMATGGSSQQLVAQQLRAQNDNLMAATAAVSRSLCFCRPTTYHWYLSDWAGMKRTALATGSDSLESPRFNAYNYSVSIIVDLKRFDRRRLKFGCFMALHPSSNDSELEWPFSKVFTVGVIHPRDRRNVIADKVDSDLFRGEPPLQKPKGQSNLGIGAPGLTTAGELDNRGFVHNNTLHLFLEIEP